jgi:hypothetical protein
MKIYQRYNTQLQVYYANKAEAEAFPFPGAKNVQTREIEVIGEPDEIKQQKEEMAKLHKAYRDKSPCDCVFDKDEATTLIKVCDAHKRWLDSQKITDEK